MVVDAFGGALGGQQGTTAKEITLTITCAEPVGEDPVADAGAESGGGSSVLKTIFGFSSSAASAPTTTAATAAAVAAEAAPHADRVLIKRTQAGSYTAAASADRRSVQVSFANLFVGEQRDVLLELEVPAVRNPSSLSAEGLRYPLIDVRASYASLDGAVVHAVADTEDAAAAAAVSEGVAAEEVARCVVRRLRSEPRTERRNVDVDAQINRFIASDALKRALELADMVSMSR
jgi:hypothetical protein